jgi:hypothetical protein
MEDFAIESYEDRRIAQRFALATFYRRQHFLVEQQRVA